jgi:hypothetical protein
VKGAIASWMSKSFKTHSSQQSFLRMEVGSSRDGDDNCLSGDFMNVVMRGEWWRTT